MMDAGGIGVSYKERIVRVEAQRMRSASTGMSIDPGGGINLGLVASSHFSLKFPQERVFTPRADKRLRIALFPDG
jgi:hypothetical protein